MLIILGIIIVGLAIALVAYPILRPAESPLLTIEDADRQAWEELIARRDDTLRAIKDLEFDYRVGKVSPEDFQVFLARLKAEAAEILKQMDARQAEKESALAAALEAEIAAERQARRAGLASAATRVSLAGDGASAREGTALEKEMEKEIRQARRRGTMPTTARACPRCGHAATPEDRFCGHCGAALPEQTVAACAYCGTSREPTDRFCANCGRPLPPM
jgi:hypothetical protein